MQLITRLKKKLNTAVPPPNNIEMNALNDPTSMLIFPFTIDQMESSKVISVPTFCLRKSTIPFTLNTSTTTIKVNFTTNKRRN